MQGVAGTRGTGTAAEGLACPWMGKIQSRNPYWGLLPTVKSWELLLPGRLLQALVTST